MAIAPQSQQIVVLVFDFLGDKFLVSFSNLVIPSVIGQHIAGEERFRIISQDTGPKTAVCCFDVALTMVNTDDNLVIQSFHFRSSLVVVHDGLIEPLVCRQYRLAEIPAIDACEG